MRPSQIALILLMFAAVSCGNRQDKMQRDQQNYDVVQEGSTSGSATLTVPTDTATTMTTSATTTNVDTTTAFTLPQTITTQSTAPPGTIAGSLPTTTGGSMSGYNPPPRPRPRPTPPPTDTSTNTVAPPPTDTTSTSAQPPTTTSTQGLI